MIFVYIIQGIERGSNKDIVIMQNKNRVARTHFLSV